MLCFSGTQGSPWVGEIDFASELWAVSLGTGGIRQERRQEKILLEVPGICLHFGDDVETQCNRKFMESTSITLANTSSTVGYGPGFPIFSNQVRPQVEGLGLQPGYKTFSLQFVAPEVCSGTRIQQNHHQREQKKLIQQLMAADAVFHIQMLRGSWKVLWRKKKD